MYRLILNLLVIGSLALVSMKPLAQAQSASLATVINGDITSNTTWTLSGSPYQVQSIVTVHSGVTLTIEPGVQITFADNTRLNVNGTLVAEGFPDDQILFTAANPTPGAWQGVWIYAASGQRSSGNRLKYVTIEYGGGGIANGANLYVSDGDINISYSIFRNGSENGLSTWNDVVANVSDTQFTGNQGYAALFSDPANMPALARLAGSGNGVNVIALGGIGHSITGTNFLMAAGLPYQWISSATVSQGSQLVIEPDVEVRFASHARLDIRGSLISAGTIDHPVLITGATKIPGSWDGLNFLGPYNAPALGDFRYTTVEYGGGGTYAANIYVSTGRVTIDHSTIRDSSVDGLRLDAFSSQSSIQASQITGNAAYGVRNKDTHPPSTAVASANFWGDPSGPVSDGVCNPGAKGDRVSTNVVFQPFMGDGSTDPGAVPEIGAFSLAITPHQWYFPANYTPLYIDVVVYDGKGQPAAGRKVSLTTTLGNVQVGEATDPSGHTFAILRSSTPGEARLTATLADMNGCESALSQTAVVTFTPGQVDVPGMTNAQSPYVNPSLTIDPLPVMVGVPTKLRATLTNPYDIDVSVDATFGFAQAGIGLVFGPAGEVNGFVIPAKATRTMEVLWNPPISGHYCIDLEGTIYQAGAATAPRNSTPLPLKEFHWVANLDSSPGMLKSPEAGNILNRSANAQNWIGDGQFILSTFTDRASLVGGFLQGQLFGNILGFINQAGGAINCALAGGTSCGGWSGPSMQFPLGSLGSLSDDPPRQDYKVVAVPETLNLPVLASGPDMPAGRAAVLNDFMTASGKLATMEIATVVSFDRYSGAVQAGDSTWASIQANAYVAYLKQTGQYLLDNQKAIQALILEIRAEGYTDMIITQADFEAYQDRLRIQGWNATERQAAAIAGLTAEGLELIRQSIINADPATAAGSQLDALQARADFYGRLGNAILNPPAFGFVTGGHGHGPAEEASAANHLVRLYASTETIQVGNPLTQTATIDLKVRPLGLPTDWIISLSQNQVILDPGGQITLTVGIQPGLPLVQGSQPGLAIEGYVGNQLIGGYAIDLAAPNYVDYQTPFRVNLPFMIKP